MAASDLAQAVEQAHRAVIELVNGNPEPQKQMFSRQDDVSLMNPFGATVRGWEPIAEILERLAPQMSEGEVNFENLVTYESAELGFIVEIEHNTAKFAGREDAIQWDLRVTTILRPEDGEWKIVHRHADAIATPQPFESVLKK